MKYLIAVLVAGFLMIKLLLKEQIPENWMNSAAQIPGFLENKTLLAYALRTLINTEILSLSLMISTLIVALKSINTGKNLPLLFFSSTLLCAISGRYLNINLSGSVAFMSAIVTFKILEKESFIFKRFVMLCGFSGIFLSPQLHIISVLTGVIPALLLQVSIKRDAVLLIFQRFLRLRSRQIASKSSSEKEIFCDYEIINERKTA